MLKYIEKLQKQPESVRRMTLFISVTVIMAVIVIIWLSTLSVRFSPEINKENNSNTPSPFSVMKSNALDFYGGFRGGIGDIQERFK